MNLLFWTNIISSFLVVCGEKIRYDDYRVYSITIENNKQLKALRNLEQISDGISLIETPAAPHQMAELIVSPQKLPFIAEFFEFNKLKHHIQIRNLQK